MSVLARDVWDAQLAHSGRYDKILVDNLEVSVNAGTDVWGRKKKQRATISVVVTLGQHFTSASTTDTVDQSTIHYGTLSRAIQARLLDGASEWVSSATLSAIILDSVRGMAGSTCIHAIQTTIKYVKGSMFGESIGYTTCNNERDGTKSNTLCLQNVRIPCLIGVNPNERLRKQPVVVNLWVDCISDDRVDDYAQLEQVIFDMISETTYQTIESLLAYVVNKLRLDFFSKDKDQDVWIKLRAAKPLAVPSAEAPAVEITRCLFD